MITDQDTKETRSDADKKNTEKGILKIDPYKEHCEEVYWETFQAMKDNGWDEEHNG